MEHKQFTSIRSLTQEEYGQVQTLCDIIKAANEEKHFKSTQEVFEGISPIMARYIKRGTIGELTRHHIEASRLTRMTSLKESWPNETFSSLLDY